MKYSQQLKVAKEIVGVMNESIYNKAERELIEEEELQYLRQFFQLAGEMFGHIMAGGVPDFQSDKQEMEFWKPVRDKIDGYYDLAGQIKKQVYKPCCDSFNDFTIMQMQELVDENEKLEDENKRLKNKLSSIITQSIKFLESQKI